MSSEFLEEGEQSDSDTSDLGSAPDLTQGAAQGLDPYRLENPFLSWNIIYSKFWPPSVPKTLRKLCDWVGGEVWWVEKGWTGAR